jgi:hypothetical protein
MIVGGKKRLTRKGRIPNVSNANGLEHGFV